ncbi:MAG: DUF2703 domain-containing protein [Candidatus Glassbacteria bacterium]|nr:DUF2703 domain-containing protein [Candidatus Glassbacteria bacterium]
MRLQFLYYPDCPSHAQGLERLKKVLGGMGLDHQVEVTCVDSEEQARELNFIGSPTVLVDGEDIDPQGLEGQAPALTCRIYRLEDGRFSPLPSEQMILRALERAAAGPGQS